MNTPLQAPAMLACPDCDAPITLQAEQRFEGASVHCPHCGFDAVIQRERVGHGEHVRWELIDAGDDDEP